MERYILKYLQDSTNNAWKKRYYDYMKMRLDSTLWGFGAHRAVGNLERTIEHLENYVIPRKNSAKAIYGILLRAFDRKFLANRRLRKQAAIQSTSESMVSERREHKVFCAFHLPWLLPNETIHALNDQGIDIDFISDTNKPWSKSVSRLLSWYANTELVPFNELINDAHVNELREIYNQLLEDFRKTDYDAVFVHSTEVFETKILIDVFKDCKKISMELLHGIPGRDAVIESSRVDYYLVYGEKIKENCLSFGCDPKKIHVVGDCKYVDALTVPSSLRCSLDDVLVMTSATSYAYRINWAYDQFSINDRSLLITYLYSIEKVLKENGVTHARLRPHPHVSRDWISRYVDMDFYELDDRWNMEQSLDKATCCLSQNSTIVFEAMMRGVSCIVYEPGDGKRMVTNSLLCPPFDGSDMNMRVANTEEELSRMLQERYCPSTEICSQYMENFKPEVIREILEKEKEKK